MPRVMTVPGTLSELDDEEDERAATSCIASDVPSSAVCELGYKTVLKTPRSSKGMNRISVLIRKLFMLV
jgi:hypothetical protein